MDEPRVARALPSTDQECPSEGGLLHGKPEGSQGSRCTSRTTINKERRGGYLQMP